MNNEPPEETNKSYLINQWTIKTKETYNEIEELKKLRNRSKLIEEIKLKNYGTNFKSN